LSQVEVKKTTVKIPFGNSEVDLVVEERGKGKPFLLLHGGAGPVSMARFAALLAGRGARVITPVHPGFARTPRPDELNSAKGLAQVYSGLLAQLGVDDVTVIGNSIGGWIASELALLHSPRVVRIIVLDGAGIEVESHPIANISKLPLDETMKLSYHDPKPFRIDPATMTDDQKAVIGANRAALQAYSGEKGFDPSLKGRLAKITTPTLVIWGDSDRIVDTEYGRAWAAAIPGAKFVVIPDSGHFPQIEEPEKLLDAIQ
jgi:pimeloyl-ACP methyl ester carboxylesterase